MLNLNDKNKKISLSQGLGRSLIILILAVLAVGAIIFYRQISSQGLVSGKNNSSDIRQVRVASVHNLSLNLDPLPLLGEVQSQSSATVYSQVSGEVVGVYKKVGDYVYANQVIAEINNWSQKSAVAQAEAGVELAQASLDKIEKGGTDTQTSLLKTALDSAQTTLSASKISVVNTLNDAFAKTDDAIRNKVDSMFSNPQRDNPQVLFPVADSQLEIDIEWKRYVIEDMLDKWESSLNVLSVNDDLLAELDRRKIDLDFVRVFLDKMALAVNTLSPNSNLSETTISAWKVSLSATRTVVNGTITSLATAKSSLSGATSGVEVAQLNYDQALSGGRIEDITAAKAQLKQAEAGLQLANANLEKTIIRASLSGTINSLDLERGDFVSAFTPVVNIANNKSLEIITYITEENRKDLTIGSQVSIGSQWQGVVKKIAPALDPQTKKIKVEISVNDSTVSLTNGQSVSLLLQRVPLKNQTVAIFSVPISAIKIGADQAVVFTVDSENRLVAHQVVLGAISGGKIVLAEGVTVEMEIVTDARGLQAGQEVVVRSLSGGK